MKPHKCTKDEGQRFLQTSTTADLTFEEPQPCSSPKQPTHPNIPDLPSISNSSYGPPGDCYEPCHVNASFMDDRPCSPDGYGDHLALDSSSVATTTVAIGPTGSVAAADGGVGGASGGGRTQRPCCALSVTVVVTVVTVWWAAGRTRGRHRTLCS
ncbi:hypothetical protein HPB51_026261 [Rhipicephalus microplus]|uniref:Uncharacterized protein n=1 Tax=Rhipicephalus microplus TaxID=6941 RepID=A0A9J6D835_RHIMP|nr:hypothetical protein HPB51_026261 [Rhipicephalus microplus]